VIALFDRQDAAFFRSLRSPRNLRDPAHMLGGILVSPSKINRAVRESAARKSYFGGLEFTDLT
jgi:hypothetical protein